MKRGDMSMQTIVVAVIVLLIAAILIYLVGTKLGLFGQSTGACEARGGQCVGSCAPGTQPFYLGNTECGEGSVCCIEGGAIFGPQ